MTGTPPIAKPTESPLCLDCSINLPTHTIRRRTLCSPCLQRFVSSKILKRLETIKPRNQKTETDNKPTYLVPLSGGVSSVTLLSVLCAHVRRQSEKTGRVGYNIVACHVDVSGDADQTSWWSGLAENFPECEFVAPLSLSSVFTLEPNILHDLLLLGLEKKENEHEDDFMVRLFTSARSATARSELHEILLRRLIVAVAKERECKVILWGHSDTKLAATTLALVAKGRGGSVASELVDGSVLWDVRFAYPSRDLYKDELQTCLDCEPRDITEYILNAEREDVDGGRQKGTEPVVSLKGLSIDKLLEMYIGREGEKYPGIMANVVRTSGKLIAPDAEESRRCRLCAAHVNGPDVHKQLLCYGCQRMKQDIRT